MATAKNQMFGSLLVVAALLGHVVLVSSQTKDGSRKNLASFRGGTVTEEEVGRAAADDLQKLEAQRLQFIASYERNKHQILEMNLARLLEDKLLTAEAARRGITREQLLAAEVQAKVKETTPEEVRAYYEANKQQIGQPFEQIGARIQQYLQAENYNNAKGALVEQLKKTYGATTTMEPLRAAVDPDGPAKGPAAAPVTLVEFSDFQCPYCARFAATLHQVLNQYGDRVRLVYRNFPLSQMHPYAEKAAEAGLCAGEQDRFWEMHDLMFRTQGQLKPEDLKVKAAQLQLNTEKFSACLESGRYAEKVRQDLNTGSKLGISGTPAMFINGRFLSGAEPFEAVAKIIDEELRTEASLPRLTSSVRGCGDDSAAAGGCTKK